MGKSGEDSGRMALNGIQLDNLWPVLQITQAKVRKYIGGDTSLQINSWIEDLWPEKDRRISSTVVESQL